MNNAEQLRKLTFGDSLYFDCTYSFIPTMVQRKCISIKPTKVRMRCATEEDIPFLYSYIKEYNERYGIEYEEGLEEDITSLVRETGMFIIMEGSRGVFGVFYITITQCNAPIRNYRVGQVVNISNLILSKQFVDNGSVYLETYAVIMERILNWGIFDSGCIFDVNIFMSGSTAFTVWQHIANTGGTLFIGEANDGFNAVVIAVDGFIKNSRGLRTMICKNIYHDNIDMVCDSCSKALIKHFDETEFSLDVDGKLPAEDMSYFVTGLYKNEPTVSLALCSLFCDDLTKKIEDRSFVEQYREKNGFYFPLIINCNREVVANKVTYWILKERGVEYVDCIIE